jgi:hypothetical protein
MAARVIFVAVFAAALVANAAALCKCEDKDLPNAGNCTLKAHVCGCIKGTSTKYQATGESRAS